MLQKLLRSFSIRLFDKRSNVLLKSLKNYNSSFSQLLRKTGISRAQRSDKLYISDAKFPNMFEFTHLHLKQKGKTSVELQVASKASLRYAYFV